MDSKITAQAIAEHSDVTQLTKLDTVPWYRKPNLRLLYLGLIPAVLGCNMTSGYDGSVINGLQAVAAWNEYFNHPQGAILGIMSAMFMFGEIASLPVTPHINDHLGRKKSIIIGSIMVGVVLQSAAVNLAMFLVARFVIGFGVPISITAAVEMTAELSHPSHRSIITGMFNNSWYAGSIIAAGVTLGTYNIPSQWSWRIPSLLQFSPSILQLIFIWWIPESPRWLVAKDRHEEARAILVKYHGEGDNDAALPQAELLEIQRAIQLEMEGSKRRWVDLLTTPANRRRTFIAATVGLFHAWSGNGLISYYLPKVLANVGISSKKEQNQINLSISCMTLVTSSIAAFSTQRLSRRLMWLASFGLMAVSYWALTATSATFAETGSKSAASGTVGLIFVYQAVYSLMQPLQMIYTSEIFPYTYRAKGLALEELFNQAGAAFNQFVNPIGLAAIAWKYYIVYCVWVPVEWLVMFFFYPETKGPTLEELTAIFDGVDIVSSKDVEDVEAGAWKPKTIHSQVDANLNAKKNLKADAEKVRIRIPDQNPSNATSCPTHGRATTSPVSLSHMQTSQGPCQRCRRLDLECTFVYSDQGPTTTREAHLVKPTQDVTQAGTARRRALYACESCHALKARCSGGRPKCTRCERRGLDCSYPQRSRDSSDRARKSRLVSLVSKPSDKSGSPEDPRRGEERLGIAHVPSPNITLNQGLLRKDVLTQHIDAYFNHVYPLPGYDFIHRPSVLEDLQNDRIPGILCTAICATVAMFVSHSDKDSRAVSIQWSKAVDNYINNNMNRLEILNLQLTVLSMFQHFAYRQFGSVWLMHGWATRLALAFQLNEDRPFPLQGRSPQSLTREECLRRLLWSVFHWDRMLAAGIDEFVGLHDEALHVQLPCNEHGFQYELPQQTCHLSDGINEIAQRNLGSKGFLLLLLPIRHRILKTTKSFLRRRDALTSAHEIQEALRSLLALKAELKDFYKSLPSHLEFSDRSLFSHSSPTEFAGFITLHTWFFLCSSDLYRICLPGPVREGAPASLLAAAPSGFREQWQSLAVSFALGLARIWEHLQDLKREGRLNPSLSYLPMSPTNTVIIQQSTKILLLARRFGLYDGIIDPLTGAAATLDDQLVERLCWSNVAYLDGMAAIAPLSAVVQRDVREMIVRELRRSRSASVVPRDCGSPVSNEVQRRNILSRYHPLSMGLASSGEESAARDDSDIGRHTDGIQDQPSTLADSEPYPTADQSLRVTGRTAGDVNASPAMGQGSASETRPQDSELQPLDNQGPNWTSLRPSFEPFLIANSIMIASDLALPYSFDDSSQPNGGQAVLAAHGEVLTPNYAIAPSQFDMDGELNWFMIGSPFGESEYRGGDVS
ncbi:hypothetical protein VTK73DRAFT_1077 [Phialemonium thermophilum]|uniref:Major facilitator superfamily (MFS) profile domain-containing protein n=1 Tax=Phialemonium thermophilum TaxID=223376 RepID=A0ABR3XBJ6_9PEZI